MKCLRLVLAVLVITNSSAIHSQGVRSKRFDPGFPDLDKNPPFADQGPKQAAALRTLVGAYAQAPCPGDSIAIASTAEICGRPKDNAMGLLQAMSHGLPPGQFGRLWRTDLDGDREPEILVQYDAKSGGDRYAAFFAFQWKTGTYQVTAASWFLGGSLHAVQPFGPQATRTVFLRFVSCTECEPWVYLTPLDFLARPDGDAFIFSYSADADASWEPQIEYVLPGNGHSIDAKVETRLPQSPVAGGPHLLQHFDVEGGPAEWWSFTCIARRCNATKYTGKAPAAFLSRWNSARPL